MRQHGSWWSVWCTHNRSYRFRRLLRIGDARAADGSLNPANFLGQRFGTRLGPRGPFPGGAELLPGVV